MTTSACFFNGILALVAVDKLQDKSYRKYSLIIKVLCALTVTNFAVAWIAFGESGTFQYLQYVLFSIIFAFIICQNQVGLMLLNILAIYFSILTQSVDKETQWKASLEMAFFAMAMALIFHIWFTHNKVLIQLHLLKL